MTALAASRGRSKEVWNQKQFTLASTYVAYKGGKCCILPGTNTVVPASASVGLLEIGVFMENMDATSAAKLVNVDLCRDVVAEWWPNSGTNPVVANDLGAMAYSEDDNVVGNVAATFPLAGRIWGIETTRGVLVERITPGSSLAGLVAAPGAAIAFASADIVIGNNPVPGTVYDVPTSAANSTISLPATAKAGTWIHFKADGTKNGHTVQYRDVTTAITTALTASKRHLVSAYFDGSKWFANAYISP